MPRGRPAKPKHLKVFKHRGRDVDFTALPEAQKGEPTRPRWLAGEAKKKWIALIPHLQQLGILALVDGDTLAVYCQAWAEFRRTTKIIEDEGGTITSESGHVSPHPAVAQQRSSWEAIRQFSKLFGLDPASRVKLRTPKKPPRQELEDLLA